MPIWAIIGLNILSGLRILARQRRLYQIEFLAYCCRLCGTMIFDADGHPALGPDGWCGMCLSLAGVARREWPTATEIVDAPTETPNPATRRLRAVVILKWTTVMVVSVFVLAYVGSAALYAWGLIGTGHFAPDWVLGVMGMLCIALVCRACGSSSRMLGQEVTTMGLTEFQRQAVKGKPVRWKMPHAGFIGVGCWVVLVDESEDPFPCWRVDEPSDPPHNPDCLERWDTAWVLPARRERKPKPRWLAATFPARRATCRTARFGTNAHRR